MSPVVHQPDIAALQRLERIDPSQIRPKLLEGMPLEFFRDQRIVPICTPDGGLAIAVADPANIEAIDALLGHLARVAPEEGIQFSPLHCRVLACPAEEIEGAIGHCYYSAADTQLEELVRPSGGKVDRAAPTGQTLGPEDILNIDERAPAIRLAKILLYQAVKARASDIHLEPSEDGATVRFRIDGVLHRITSIPKAQVAALSSRLKIMANLNIAERRLPQDGQSRIKIGRDLVDIRVSTIPTIAGERVVLRLLDKGQGRLGLSDLGLEQGPLERFKDLIRMPHGVILLTGPTGSGKTTSLYAALSELDRTRQNILTVEDPVEYQIPGVGQMQVKPKIGLTFATALRHILRQDPDVLMIGEIRDVETARIAVQASLTGHLVLSTLHTNDAASAVTRLADMGIEPYLISSSVIACLAQRLVRAICPYCKAEDPDQALDRYATAFPSSDLTGAVFYKGSGCERCMHTGYLGRTGIFELMVVDESMRDLIAGDSPAHLIRQAAIDRGMMPLRAAGMAKVVKGITTVEEVCRVTQDVLVLSGVGRP